MSLKEITPKLLISSIIFFAICAWGGVSDVQAKPIGQGHIPIEGTRLVVISVENETDQMEFQIFNGSDRASAFVFPQSEYRYHPGKEIHLSVKEPLAIKCCKGSFLPVYIQDGNCFASGKVEGDFEGPFYISMWLQYPQVVDSHKTHVRYVVKKGHTGKIGIKIDNKGGYRLVAHENVNFITGA